MLKFVCTFIGGAVGGVYMAQNYEFMTSTELLSKVKIFFENLTSDSSGAGKDDS